MSTLNSLNMASVLALFMVPGVFAACTCANPADVKIGGYLGLRLNGCLEHNVKTADGIYLTDIFKAQPEKNIWQTEFWGKWMHAAVPLYRYSSDAALKATIDASVKTSSPPGKSGRPTPSF